MAGGRPWRGRVWGLAISGQAWTPITMLYSPRNDPPPTPKHLTLWETPLRGCDALSGADLVIVPPTHKPQGITGSRSCYVPGARDKGTALSFLFPRRCKHASALLLCFSFFSIKSLRILDAGDWKVPEVIWPDPPWVLQHPFGLTDFTKSVFLRTKTNSVLLRDNL